jgi:hypothetical protein
MYATFASAQQDVPASDITTLIASNITKAPGALSAMQQGAHVQSHSKRAAGGLYYPVVRKGRCGEPMESATSVPNRAL